MLKHGDRTVQAFVVYPEVKTKAPVIILIHEIFGLSDWAKEMADELAGQGFIVVAPDLLTGFGPNGGGSMPSPAGRHHQSRLRSRSSGRQRRPRRRGRLRQKDTRRQWQNRRRRLLLGRRQVLRLRRPPQRSLRGLRLLRPGPADVTTITAPVYGFYAGNDARIGATVPATTAAMKAAGKKYEPVTYDGAGHGFMRAGEDPNNTVPGNKTAREQAFTRLVTLIKDMKSSPMASNAISHKTVAAKKPVAPAISATTHP